MQDDSGMIGHIQFPDNSGFLGDEEARAFTFWSSPNPPELDHIIQAISSQFPSEVCYLSHCINTIEYAVSTDVENKYIFPSLEAFLVCVLLHFLPPPAYAGISFTESDVERINAALVLWQSGLVPLYDGTVWRLHNAHEVVHTVSPSSSS